MIIQTRKSFLNSLGIGIGSTAALVTLPSLFSLARPKQAYAGKKLNVALCGLGNYAELLATGLVNSQYCRLAGIVTRHEQKAKKWKKDYNIPEGNIYNYQNFDHIKENPGIDLVYVVLPNALHKEFVIRAAKAGKHVITEKPMAVSVKDCEEIIAACSKANVQLAVGYRLHYEPYNLEIKRFGQEKTFGQVRMMEASLAYKTYDTTNTKVAPGFTVDDYKDWRLKKNMGGGPLMDLGIYCVQSSRYVSGQEPVSLTAQYGPVNNKLMFSEVEESITWQMNFPSGAVASCATSCGFDMDRLFASADDGFFELSPGLSYGPFKLKTSKGEIKLPATNQQAVQLDHIAKSILENKPLPSHITGEEGIKDIRIINAIFEAATTGSKVMLA